MKDSVVSYRAAQLSIVAAILYHVLLFALIFIRQDLDPYWHTISEWAIGPYGWIMVTAFLLSALSYFLLALAVWPLSKRAMSRIGLGILLICAMGTTGVGVFVTDPMSVVSGPMDGEIKLSTGGLIHMISGTLAMMLLPLAALLINLGLAFRSAGWSKSKTPLFLTAGLPLLGFVGFMIHLNLYVLPLGDYAYGPEVPLGWPPRILFLTYMIWLITVASQTIKVNRLVAGSLETRNQSLLVP